MLRNGIRVKRIRLNWCGYDLAFLNDGKKVSSDFKRFSEKNALRIKTHISLINHFRFTKHLPLEQRTIFTGLADMGGKWLDRSGLPTDLPL